MLKIGEIKMPALTRQEMEAILARRESVMYRGQLITRLSDLPTEAELAVVADTAQARKEAQASLQAQLESVKAQLALLESGQQVSGDQAPQSENPFVKKEVFNPEQQEETVSSKPSKKSGKPDGE